MRLFILATFFIFVWNNLSAQAPNCLLMGSIEKNTQDELIVEIDKRYINNTTEEFGIMPNVESKFGVSIRIEVPQLIKLKYGDKSCEVFVEPYDTLIVNFNGFTFPENLDFQGRGKDNNYLWQAYRQRFPYDEILFNYRQYRKGIYYYKIHQKNDSTMRATTPDAYLRLLEIEKEKKQALLDLFAKDPQKKISPAFNDFMFAEIHYGKVMNTLAYGDVYRGRYMLKDSFFNFVDAALIQKDFYLGNVTYRNFLMAYTNFKLRDKTKGKNPYVNQYYYAQENLKDRSKYFTMARMVSLALRKNAQEDALPIYEDFIKENPYYELDKLVLDPFQKSNQFAAGALAPPFTLLDKDGKPFSLHQFRGKVVYLDFWATWCRPCLEKQAKMQKLEPQFDAQEVVFIHVSLDSNKEKWKQAVEEQKLVGIHLFFDVNSSTITKDYEVLSVPKFYLINKKGNFAYTPSSYDSEELALAIKRLLQN